MGPPTYVNMARTDATPIAATTQPAMAMSQMPAAAANPTASQVATHMDRAEILPEATILGGPTRSAGSAPRAALEASLAKLAATWMARAPTSAARKASARRSEEHTSELQSRPHL